VGLNEFRLYVCAMIPFKPNRTEPVRALFRNSTSRELKETRKQFIHEMISAF
jgi:hypothetical protein